MKKEITYLDSASTTKIDPRVLDVMQSYFSDCFGNASSDHQFGRKSKDAVENARKQTANIINCEGKEIIFTSGSTESINLAIKGYVECNPEKGNHIITVKTEHKAVLSTCEYLETKGFEVTYLDVDKNGLILFDQLRDSVKENTSLVVIMHVNNETGVIQPIKKIGEFCRDMDITFFCDATQAVGKVTVDIEKDCVDMLCFSGHKLNGPKGIGVLYKRKDIELTPIIHGGGQENGLRGGTYNTPLIVGLGKSCEIASQEFEEKNQKLTNRRKEVEVFYEDNSIGKVNFKNIETAPHIISITLNNFEAEEYLMLKSKEFVASTGSACNSEINEISHVLRAIGVKKAKNIIRISIE